MRNSVLEFARNELANTSDASKMRWTGLYIFRLVVFLLHAVSAIFIAVVATRCGASFISESFAETLSEEFHGHHALGYLVMTEGGCDDPKNISCFYGIPETYDVAQMGLQWNVFALIAAFEWISASFALGHLSGNFDPAKRTRHDVSQIKFVCLVWNLVGALWLMPYTTPMSLLQTGITLLALMIATSVQYFPIGNEDEAGIVMHFTEYCTSASLLFVGVLILYIPNPQSWAVIVGFTGILMCNLTGVAAHICKIDTEAGRIGLPFSDMDWGKVGNYFKFYIINSWICMLVSIFIIVYLSGDSFSNEDIPWWVRFILVNLLVTFTIFGIWATVCYLIADVSSKSTGAAAYERVVIIGTHGGSVLDRRSNYLNGQGANDEEELEFVDSGFKLWTSDRLGFGLTVLSALAKLPITFTVFYGLIGAPGSAVCSAL